MEWEEGEWDEEDVEWLAAHRREEPKALTGNGSGSLHSLVALTVEVIRHQQ
jgi:hypothetical protein